MTNLSDYFLVRTRDDFYKPAMMEFDGTSAYYKKAYTSANSTITVVARIKVASFTGGGSKVGIHALGPAQPRITMRIISSDHGTTLDRNRVVFIVQNSVGTVVARIYSETQLADSGIEHTVHFQYDGGAGTATLTVDGNVEDQTGGNRLAPITGTLNTGSSNFSVGGNTVGAELLTSEIGYVGMRDVANTNALDFMDAKGNPKILDESSWTEWGAQPLFWNEHGNMQNNFGTGGDMTENGLIKVGKAGN